MLVNQQTHKREEILNKQFLLRGIFDTDATQKTQSPYVLPHHNINNIRIVQLALISLSAYHHKELHCGIAPQIYLSLWIYFWFPAG